MADPLPGDKNELTPKINTRYLANAYGLRKDDVKKLLTAPTVELARFITSALDKARVCDRLEAEKRCRFTGMPPELRLRIYELLFQEIYHEEEYDFSAARNYTIDHIKAALALAHTSRILRAEVLPTCTKFSKKVETSLDAEMNNLGSLEPESESGSDYEKLVKWLTLNSRYCTAARTGYLAQRAIDNCLRK